MQNSVYSMYSMLSVYCVGIVPAVDHLLLWDRVSCLLALSELEDGPQQGRFVDQRLPGHVGGDDVFLELHELEGGAPAGLVEQAVRDGESDLPRVLLALRLVLERGTVTTADELKEIVYSVYTVDR